MAALLPLRVRQRGPRRLSGRASVVALAAGRCIPEAHEGENAGCDEQDADARAQARRVRLASSLGDTRLLAR